MKSKYTLMAEMFKALGDENRLKLMEELKDGEKNAGELLDKLSVTQPTISHHMKILCDSGIVESRKEGKWTYYSISAEGKAELLDIINSFNIARKKPSFDIEDIVVKAEEKPEEKKKTAKKPAKKKPEKKKTVEEEITMTKKRKWKRRRLLRNLYLRGADDRKSIATRNEKSVWLANV